MATGQRGAGSPRTPRTGPAVGVAVGSVAADDHAAGVDVGSDARAHPSNGRDRRSGRFKSGMRSGAFLREAGQRQRPPPTASGSGGQPSLCLDHSGRSGTSAGQGRMPRKRRRLDRYVCRTELEPRLEVDFLDGHTRPPNRQLPKTQSLIMVSIGQYGHVTRTGDPYRRGRRWCFMPPPLLGGADAGSKGGEDRCHEALGPFAN